MVFFPKPSPLARASVASLDPLLYQLHLLGVESDVRPPGAAPQLLLDHEHGRHAARSQRSGHVGHQPEALDDAEDSQM